MFNSNRRIGNGADNSPARGAPRGSSALSKRAHRSEQHRDARRHCSEPIDAAAGALESADGEYAAGLRARLAAPVPAAGRNSLGTRAQTPRARRARTRPTARPQ